MILLSNTIRSLRTTELWEYDNPFQVAYTTSTGSSIHLSTKSKPVAATKMRSWDRKAILSVIIFVAISEAVAKRPTAVKSSDSIGPDDFSFVARIVLYGGDGPYTCGGAIISPRHILTAGSCLHDKYGGRVYTGIQHGSDYHSVVTAINETFIENFTMPSDGQDVQNDIGIISLDRNLNFSLRQRIISLPTAQPAEHINAWFAGWEPVSGELEPELTFKKTQITLRSGQQCLNRGTDDMKAQKLCGHQEDPNRCPGESGSPIVSDGILYGIASIDPCSIATDRRYTNVFHLVDWIKRIISMTTS